MVQLNEDERAWVCFEMARVQNAHAEQPPGGGGTCHNFDRDARPIFLSMKFGQILFFWVGKFFSYFFWVSQNFRYFLGLTNFQLFFGSSNQ